MPGMAEDPLPGAIDTICARLRSDLENQFAALNARHHQDLGAVRRTAAAEAEERCQQTLEELRADWAARLDDEVTAIRRDADSRFAELLRSRADSDTARERLTRELDAANAETASVRKELDMARTAWHGAESALQDERTARGRAAHLATTGIGSDSDRRDTGSCVGRILTAISSLDQGHSLSHVLTTLHASARMEAPRVALFVLDAAELKLWKADGFDAPEASLDRDANGPGLLTATLHRGTSITTPDESMAAPSFAALPRDAVSIAIPLLVGGNPVAVLYADHAGAATDQLAGEPFQALQVVCQHAALALAHITTLRAAEAMAGAVARYSSVAGVRGGRA